MVKIFRKTGHKSFVVQLSSSLHGTASAQGGLVEIHCTKVDAQPQEEAVCLFARLSDTASVGSPSNEHELERWSANLERLGQYCLRTRAFVGCHLKLRMSCISSQDAAPINTMKKEMASSPLQKIHRTKKLKWTNSQVVLHKRL